MRDKIRKLERRNKVQDKNIKAKDDKIRSLEEARKENEEKYGRLPPSSCTDDDRAQEIIDYIHDVVKQSVQNHAIDSRRTDKFFQLLADMFLGSDLHGGQLQHRFLRQFKTFMRTTVFTPFRILRHMDLAGGY